jgi:phenylacetic acid degradation operon negative regulatory protein
MAHPSGARQSLDETLLELGITDKVVVLKAETEEIASRACLKQLAHTSWKLDGIEMRYNQFLKKFRPISSIIKKANKLNDEDCFLLRTLLIHEYRRILLSDADLPGELLPANWPGKSAFDLTANLYRTVQEGAMSYVMTNMETIDGYLPEAGQKYYSRFGGLR